MNYQREIPVDRDFFEKLEQYLQADERFSDKDRPFATLTFFTWEKKLLIFKVDDELEKT